jgi:putative membrane-bound dehydrogenase-like protein
MTRTWWWTLIGCALLFPGRAAAQNVQHGLKVPAGFEVTEFADAKLANDIHCMTLDPQGRVVVAGRGYIKILVDDDGDGKADRAILFSDRPKDGAMGLFWEGKHLYVTGDGGLQRFTTSDGDRADGPPEMIRKMKTGTEHGAHAILRGPDGWLYVLCGNNANIDKSYAELPTSPVSDPVAGCVLRFSQDLKKSEIVAEGFRNPYGFDFNTDGELFTWDADNERCVSLPWYEGTRFYHVIPGGNYGWLNPQIMVTWRRPPYFIDVVPPVIDLGRGSPTGVTCYRHVQFPEKYRGGFFCSDWTFGKVWFLRLQRAGASYKAEKEVFLEAAGDNGFAPTAMAVHPETGDLYISIGGRGTRGAVYRIRYKDGMKGASAKAAAKWQPAKRSLDWDADQSESWWKSTLSKDPAVVYRALALILRHHKHLNNFETWTTASVFMNHEDPTVRMLGAKLLMTFPDGGPGIIYVNIRSKGFLSKWLIPYTTWSMVVTEHQELGLVYALLAMRQPGATAEKQLACLRVAQLALGDFGAARQRGTVWEGYSARDPAKLERIKKVEDFDFLCRELAKQLESGVPLVQREAARTLALVGYSDDGITRQLGIKLSKDSDPVENIHYLAVLARLGQKPCRELRSTVATAVLTLDSRLDRSKANRDLNWPLRIGELVVELVRLDPDLPAALLKHPEFGRPDHVLFTQIQGFDRKAAAALFLEKAQTDPDYRWNAGVVQLLGELPDEQLQPVLRKLWGKAGVDAAILPLLARKPDPADRPKFLDGLSSSNLATVRVCLQALAALSDKGDNAETAALIRALGTLPPGKEAAKLREAAVAHLQKTTKQQLGPDRNAWLKWFATVDAKRAAALANPDGVDVAAWDKRLAKLDWSKGDAAAGKTVFVKASCAACHSGVAAIGPDLNGITGRFSRDDLFTAILQPSRDVADRYQTTVVETTAGKLYQGIIVYEAVDGLLLVTGPAQNVRIPGNEIASKTVSRVSLMPAGLLDNLLDQEIVDLYAYLKSLGTAK